VLVVDSDDRVRESLTGLLAIGDHVLVVGSAGSAAPALDLVVEEYPDIVVVDPRLPELDAGLAFIRDLRARVPGIRILAMSWSETVEATVLACGADGFCRKTFRPTELIAAIGATCPRSEA
jgi:DNA-binding NarL/FixJ family response regulator